MMPDGTLLVLEQVTVGKQHGYDYVPPDKSMVPSWLSGQTGPTLEKQTATLHLQQQCMLLWMSRWNQSTLDPLDFEWWHYCALIDESGEEVEDQEAYRYTRDAAGSGMFQGVRPWAPASKTKPDLLLASSQFPILRRPSGPCRLRVYDSHGAVVAEFDVPYPNTAEFPQWSPDPLPATRVADDISVTFTGVRTHKLPDQTGPGKPPSRRRPHWSLDPQFTVARNGLPTTEWKQESLNVSDALGNEDPATPCRLSTRESAWKLKLTLARDETRAFADNEQWTSPPYPLPGSKSSESLDATATVRGVDLAMLAIGRGIAEYTETWSSDEKITHSPCVRRVGDETYGLSHSKEMPSGGPTRSTVAISGNLVHLVLKLSRKPPNHREQFRVQDDQGRDVPHARELIGTPDRGIYYLFVNPAADAKSLQLTVFIHSARTVELLIAPPMSD